MTPLDQLSRLIAAGAWIQEAGNAGFGPKIPLGAAVWIDGRGLLFAELGAEHQGHIHLVSAERLDLDGHMVDAYGAGGRLVATVHGMNAEEVKNAGLDQWIVTIQGAAWQRAWAQEIETAKG